MEIAENLKLLGLSKKEGKVLLALQAGGSTPLKLSKDTGVSRTAVYAILQNLKKRGLVKSHIKEGKKGFSLTNEREIEETLYETKRTLLNIPEGREEVKGVSDSMVIVHRGKEAVRKIILDLLEGHKNERFYATVGKSVAEGWDRLFSVEEINRFNKTLKQNNIIAEGVYEDGWLERETARLGISWAKDFEGRTARVNVINGEYFQHGAQIFIFRQSMYLMALGEELVVEVRHSEIQKMVLSLFRFIQDNSQVVDANELLRELMGVKQ